jgi:hypothetical protein
LKKGAAKQALSSDAKGSSSTFLRENISTVSAASQRIFCRLACTSASNDRSLFYEMNVANHGLLARL